MNKHPDDYVFGLDRDVQNKIAAKFDPEKQAQAQAWIETLTGAPFSGSFHESLKDGTLLCQALNVIKPGAVGKINTGKMPFVQRENIVNYLEGCKKLGMKVIDCFVTQDLYEGDNMVAVIDQIFALGALSRNVEGFDGPFLGVKFAEENRREFSEEVLSAGRTAIPLHNAGSIAVEKDKGTDKIVRYGKVGQEMGAASSEISQQVGGSIEIEKSKGTDMIVRYGKVGQEMGQASSEVSQQMAGDIEVDKGKGTDMIVRYGKVGQELGHSSAEVSQQTAGSLEVDKGKGTDMIVRYGKVGQEMGQSSSEVSQQMAGDIEVDKGKGTDMIVRYGKVGQEMGHASSEIPQHNQGSLEIEKEKQLDMVTRSQH